MELERAVGLGKRSELSNTPAYLRSTHRTDSRWIVMLMRDAFPVQQALVLLTNTITVTIRTILIRLDVLHADFGDYFKAIIVQQEESAPGHYVHADYHGIS
jgi:hypothetical protein